MRVIDQERARKAAAWIFAIAAAVAACGVWLMVTAMNRGATPIVIAAAVLVAINVMLMGVNFDLYRKNGRVQDVG